MNTHRTLKDVRLFAIILLVLMGLAACANGYMLMKAPDGRLLGMNVALLQHSPFTDFFIPGVILFSVLGIGSCVTAVVVARRVNNEAWYVLLEGAAVLIWIVVQVAMIRNFHIMQVVIGGMGILMLLAGGVMNRLKAKY